MEWKNQVIAHDVYDWDLHLPPILVDTATASTSWSRAARWATSTPSTATPASCCGRRRSASTTGTTTTTSSRWRARLSALPKLPLTVYPGALGGVETQMAVADGVVYAPVVNLARSTRSRTTTRSTWRTAPARWTPLDLATRQGAVDARRSRTPTYGAATVVNDLVFTTTFDGKIHALDAKTGAEVWTSKLPAGTNATVAVAGDTLVTAASYPQGARPEGGRDGLHARRRESGTDTGTTDTGATDTGATDTGATDTGATDTGATDTGGESTAAAADGAALFSANCASCHTLAAANASGKVGPNLDQLDVPIDAVVEQITNGGGVMPAFGGQLSEDEIQAIAQVRRRQPRSQRPGHGRRRRAVAPAETCPAAAPLPPPPGAVAGQRSRGCTAALAFGRAPRRRRGARPVPTAARPRRAAAAPRRRRARRRRSRAPASRP